MEQHREDISSFKSHVLLPNGVLMEHKSGPNKLEIEQ